MAGLFAKTAGMKPAAVQEQSLTQRELRPWMSGVFLLIATAVDADAACHTQLFSTKLGTVQTTTQVTDGAPCTIRLLSSVDPIYGAEIISKPKNGTASISGRTSVIYRPRPGFKGIDNYAFHWVGKMGGTPTPLTVNVTATVK